MDDKSGEVMAIKCLPEQRIDDMPAPIAMRMFCPDRTTHGFPVFDFTRLCFAVSTCQRSKGRHPLTHRCGTLREEARTLLLGIHVPNGEGFAIFDEIMNLRARETQSIYVARPFLAFVIVAMLFPHIGTFILI